MIPNSPKHKTSNKINFWHNKTIFLRTNTVQISLIDLDNHPSILLTTDPNLEFSRNENIPLMQSVEFIKGPLLQSVELIREPFMQSIDLMMDPNPNPFESIIGTKSVTYSTHNTPKNL